MSAPDPAATCGTCSALDLLPYPGAIVGRCSDPEASRRGHLLAADTAACRAHKAALRRELLERLEQLRRENPERNRSTNGGPK